MPSARAFSTLASVSSHATTSAPPASSALALDMPEAPSPNSATFLPAKLVIGIIAAAFSPPPAMLRMWGGEHAAYAALSSPLSSQLQRREAGEREHDRDDPEADHDLRLGPALLLEMMMQRRHPEHALAGEAERDHLHYHGNRFQHEQAADHGQHDLVFDRDRGRAQHAAERERAG